MLNVTQLKNFNGIRLDISSYRNNDKGKYGKAVDAVLARMLENEYNLGKGPDIPNYNFEVKTYVSGRSKRSYTTWIKIPITDIGNFHWQLDNEIQDKLVADRLIVEIKDGCILSHEFVKFNDSQIQNLKNKFDLLSRRMSKHNLRTVSSNGFILEKKSSIVEFRISNKYLDTMIIGSKTKFNDLFIV